MNVRTYLTKKSISSIISDELAAFGERVGAAIDQCEDEKECAALEDALQSLSKAKSTLDSALI